MAEAGETVSVEQTSSSNSTRDNLVEMVTALSENAGVSTSKQEVDSSEDLNKSCQDMFKTITEYLQGELNGLFILMIKFRYIDDNKLSITITTMLNLILKVFASGN